MNVSMYIQLWPYPYPNKRFDEVIYWIGFTTTQLMPHALMTKYIRIQ